MSWRTSLDNAASAVAWKPACAAATLNAIAGVDRTLWNRVTRTSLQIDRVKAVATWSIRRSLTI